MVSNPEISFLYKKIEIITVDIIFNSWMILLLINNLIYY